jgi:site-specific recombinase XerC
MLDESGGDVRGVGAVLGHQNVTTTVNTYGAEADEARKRMAALMDKAMEGVMEKEETA